MSKGSLSSRSGGHPAANASSQLKTRIAASVTTPFLVAQLAEHEVTQQCDFTLHEKVHTIAVQRQVHDSFSEGRFGKGDARGDFQDIGRVLFVPAGIPLNIRTGERFTQTFRCLMRPSEFDPLLGTGFSSQNFRLEHCLNIKHARVRSLLLQMARELEAPGHASVQLIEGLAQVLVVELVRYLREGRLIDTITRGGLKRSAYQRIIERIESDNPPPNVAELAKLAELSERHLMRAFRQSSGMTLHQQIDEARFKRAVMLLSDTDCSIMQISEQLGFRSQSAFAQAFRRWSGRSPTAYRRLAQNQARKISS